MLLWIWFMLMVKELEVELTMFSLFTLCVQCSVVTTCSTLCQTHCSPFGDFWPHLWTYGHGDFFFFTPCGCPSENQENQNFASQIWCRGLLSIAIAVCPSRLSFCDFTRFFCDLVHIQSVIGFDNSLNMHQTTKIRQNHKQLELLLKNAVFTKLSLSELGTLHCLLCYHSGECLLKPGPLT